VYKGVNAGKGERAMVICPACNADLDFDEDELDEGDEFTCGECGANLRVASLDPIELESADDEDDEDEDEDYDDDEDGDEDEADGEDDEDDDWR
jgi:alpha-aminoadipate carrier protein LysW